MSSMSRVNSLLRRFRQGQILRMMEDYRNQTAKLANRIARKRHREQGSELSPGQKGAITRRAWKEAETQTKLHMKKRRAELDVELEVERQRLIMLHCPPDTPEGRAARLANEQRRTSEEAQRQVDHVERELRRQEIEKEKHAAVAQKQAEIAHRKAERQAAADQRLAEVLAHRNSNPPRPKFEPGEEPMGWLPHMELGGLDRHWLEGVAEDDEVIDAEPVQEPEFHPLTVALRKKRKSTL